MLSWLIWRDLASFPRLEDIWAMAKLSLAWCSCKSSVALLYLRLLLSSLMGEIFRYLTLNRALRIEFSSGSFSEISWRNMLLSPRYEELILSELYVALRSWHCGVDIVFIFSVVGFVASSRVLIITYVADNSSLILIRSMSEFSRFYFIFMNYSLDLIILRTNI